MKIRVNPCNLWTFFLLCFIAYPCYTQNEFSFRVSPSYEIPTASTFFNSGIGVNATIDWSFFTFANDFDVGLSAGGSFASLPMVTGTPIILFDGRAGPFLRWRPFDRFAFRVAANAGAYQYTRADEDAINFLTSFSLGAEFHLSPYISLFADGAYTYRVFTREPLPSFGASVGLRLNLSELMSGRSRVRMEKTRQYRVFPVSWAWYEYNPIATVTITNDEPNAITNLTLSFYIDSFMSEPWIFAVVPRIASGESIEVPVTALFNEALLNLNENLNANGILQIRYRSLGARKETTVPVQMPILRRNSMSWDDDRRAAAFVSPRDSSARFFALNVASSIRSEVNRNVPRNVLYAAALVEALRLYRITYFVDPSSSYIALSENETATDSLNFPYETLYYRGGDCDDLSILFCSLLEVLGIESAFVTVPGHILTAFEVGDDDWYLHHADIIEFEGRRWMPIESTLFHRGFNAAWQSGIRQWRNAGEQAALLPIRDCWDVYPSVTVPVSGDNPPEMPELREIADAAARETGGYRWTEQQAQVARMERERRNAETNARLVELVVEINTVLEEQNIGSTTAEVTDQGIMIRLSNVQFLANSAELTKSEIAKITEIAAILRTLSGRRIRVIGHAAAAGNSAGELRLSQQRARTVAALLVSLGAVEQRNVTAIGMGSEQPIADNSSPAGMAANRRVEIIIME